MTLKGSYAAYLCMYFFYYAAYALFTVLIGVHVLDAGFSSVHVSILVSVGLLTAVVVQGLIGYLNDRFHSKKLNTGLLMLSAIGSIGFVFSKDFMSMTIYYAFVFSLLLGLTPVLEKMATTSHFRYGSIRVWGTIGFAMGSQLAGVIYSALGSAYVYTLYACLMGIAIVGFLATGDQDDRAYHVGHTTQVIEKSESLFKNKSFLVYLLIIFIFYGAFNVSTTHLPNMLVSDGLDVNMASTVISIAVLCEVPLIYYSYLFMDKMKSKVLLLAVLVGILLQVGVYAFMPITGLKIAVTILGKHTVGMTFVMTNLKIVRTIVPMQYQSSALSIVAMIGSLSAILLQNIVGVVIDHSGYAVGYMVLVCCVCLAIGISVCLRIRDDKSLTLFN